MLISLPRLLLLTLLGIFAAVPWVRQPYGTDPAAARIIHDDIDHFWDAYDAAPNVGAARAFDSLYFARASPGLITFDSTRIRGSGRLAAAMAAHPAYYASIRQTTQELDAQNPALRTAFARLQQLYPAAVFPDVYYVIGSLDAAGTIGRPGLLIGAEMFARTNDSALAGLSAWHQDVIAPPSRLPVVVMHELCHVQQRPTAEVTLLVRSLREGTCDFIAELVTGSAPTKTAFRWGAEREHALWVEFRARMHYEDVSGFLYDGARAVGRPADLGYFVGYRIARSYYERMPDKTRAIRELLRYHDARNVLKDSGYNP